ncbi:MAG TPA: SDR family oxidoreductase [Allosphingosinicella sp.]|jgi:NAD(P)-dependent dehydrogenase (short-subunit alcohol dehydrogenase family)
MPTVMITGANRGIGWEFARQYAADGWKVVATARDPEGAQEIDEIEGDVTVRRLDLDTDFFEIDWEGIAGSDPIDLFIANAGTWGPQRITGVEDAAEWINALAVNSVAPVLLAHKLLSNVAAAGGKLVAITSKMGSIADNGSGGYIAYRSSKAALNAAWRSLAIDVKPQGVAAALLHPGWVQTRMGGASAPLTREESVAGMRRVIDRLDLENSGSFFNYDGTVIPW